MSLIPLTVAETKERKLIVLDARELLFFAQESVLAHTKNLAFCLTW